MMTQHLLCPTFTPQHCPYKLPQALVKWDNALLHLIFIIKSLLLLYYPSHIRLRLYKLPQALVRWEDLDGPWFSQQKGAWPHLIVILLITSNINQKYEALSSKKKAEISTSKSTAKENGNGAAMAL
jgi:hypothetical protein